MMRCNWASEQENLDTSQKCNVSNNTAFIWQNMSKRESWMEMGSEWVMFLTSMCCCVMSQGLCARSLLSVCRLRSFVGACLRLLSQLSSPPASRKPVLCCCTRYEHWWRAAACKSIRKLTGGGKMKKNNKNRKNTASMLICVQQLQ